MDKSQSRERHQFGKEVGEQHVLRSLLPLSHPMISLLSAAKFRFLKSMTGPLTNNRTTNAASVQHAAVIKTALKPIA